MKSTTILACSLLLGCSAPESMTAPRANALRETAPVMAAEPVYAVPIDGLPAIGKTDAPVTAIVFTDYECPFCQNVLATLADLAKENADDLRIVVAERPLPFHPRAKPAALAALAAAAQGRFAPMHARLAMGPLDDEAITADAKEVGLDLARFATDRNSAEIAAGLAHVDELANRFAVEGVPTTFVNGRKIVGAAADVRGAIESELSHLTGATRRDYHAVVARGLDRAPASRPAGRPYNPFDDLRVQALRACWSRSPADGIDAASLVVTFKADGTVVADGKRGNPVELCMADVARTWTEPPSEEDRTLTLRFRKPPQP